jgi:proline racemase
VVALTIAATDYHTAGEPFRIVTEGVPAIAGSTVRERRETARADEEVNRIRTLLGYEPRGHADMYGGFLVPPDDNGAAFGVLFWHKDGYSTACGHGTIALGAWAADAGRVRCDPDGLTDVPIDVPSGRVVARVRQSGGRTVAVTFRSVPSYVLARRVGLSTSRGDVVVDVSYGGAIYASLDVSSVGLRVTPDCYAPLLDLGREVRRTLDGTPHARHPSDPRLSGVYGTILFEELGRTATGPHQRNVTVFADGAVDRSPCGSGTAARVALLAEDGGLGTGETLTHESIVGTTFTARVVEDLTVEGRAGVVPEIEGMAYPTGEHRFFLDPDDPLGSGFVLR